MQRIVEPELMDNFEQVEAYHNADFSHSHSRRVELFRERVPTAHLQGAVLDLGCGSGDIIFRFAQAFPAYSFVAVDGAAAMIELGQEALTKTKDLTERIEFIQAFIPSDAVPKTQYSVLMSHSFLHHLHNPYILWNAVKDYSSPDTFVFIADLRRPSSLNDVQKTVVDLASNEPDILQRDFYNSLCAAFTADEVREQLEEAKIAGLAVEEIDDIHMLIYGKMR